MEHGLFLKPREAAFITLSKREKAKLTSRFLSLIKRRYQDVLNSRCSFALNPIDVYQPLIPSIDPTSFSSFPQRTTKVRGRQETVGTAQLCGAHARLRYHQGRPGRKQRQNPLQRYRHSKRRRRPGSVGLGPETQLPVDG